MKTDRGIYPASKIQPPPVGLSYQDPVFGTTIKRITDAQQTEDIGFGDGRKCWACQTEYATICPFNADSTRLLIMHGSSGPAIYDGHGNFLFYPFVNGHLESMHSPRWTADPNQFIYLAGNQLKIYDIAKRQATLVRTFSEYLATNQGADGVTTMGEEDLKGNRQLIGLVGALANGTRDIFIYNLKTDTKVATLNLPTSLAYTFDNIYITPSGRLMIGWYSQGKGANRGQWLYDASLKNIRQLTGAMGHNDIGQDVDGSEVLIWPSGANTSDMGGTVCLPWGMVKVKLDDASASKTCILPFTSWDHIPHTYVPAFPGWVLVSTYTRPDLDPALTSSKPWTSLMNEIFRFSMDGKIIERLAHHQSGPANITRESRAVGNWDLSKIVFNSNFGNTFLGDNYVDVYLMEVPSVDTLSVFVPPLSKDTGFDWSTKDIVVSPQSDGTVKTSVRNRTS